MRRGIKRRAARVSLRRRGRKLSKSSSKPILCYVTDRKSLHDGAGVRELRAAIRRAIRAGVDLVQIREKDLSGRELMELAQWAVKEARAGVAKIVVNDRLDVAIASGAAGVHLGRESAPAKEVVRWVRGMRGARAEKFLVGVSCHSVEEAREAERDGADYVHFGPVFETPSKRKFGKPQGVERLRKVCEAVRIPVIAVGGIDEGKIEQCLQAGAQGVAAIRMFQK